MGIIHTEYDIDKDFENYRYSVIMKSVPTYNRQQINLTSTSNAEFINSLDEITSNADKEVLVKEHLESRYGIKQSLPNFSAKAVNLYWSTIESDFLDKLTRYFSVDAVSHPIKAYLTTLNICPYNYSESYFFIPLFASLAVQCRCIMHETMHLVFLTNYKQLLADSHIDEQGVLDINESLTILLNYHFGEFLLTPEVNNKPSTLDLQEAVKQLYLDGAIFSKILERLIQMRQNQP